MEMKVIIRKIKSKRILYVSVRYPHADRKKQTTIVEIARIANTSTATVSRVLSGADYPVSNALREAVKRPRGR